MTIPEILLFAPPLILLIIVVACAAAGDLGDCLSFWFALSGLYFLGFCIPSMIRSNVVTNTHETYRREAVVLNKTVTNDGVIITYLDLHNNPKIVTNNNYKEVEFLKKDFKFYLTKNHAWVMVGPDKDEEYIEIVSENGSLKTRIN